MGVICLEVRAEIKNLSTSSASVCKQCLLLLLLIVCEPSEKCVFPRNRCLHLRYDVLIPFSAEIHINFVVIAPNENNTDMTETNICTCSVLNVFNVLNSR